MQIGIIGLGRMGGNIARRLIRNGHQAVVHDRSLEAVAALASEGAAGVQSLADLVQGLAVPRVVWVMLPAGPATEET
ncbi:MAG TPA: NAD(P)-binding domain-containing protein, partial [Noviherbaspirillum sp.]